MSARSELLELLRVRSFARTPVVLASGKPSDFFIDCKQTVLTADGHRTAGEVLLAVVRSLGACDAVAGVELGGCPLASAVSLTSAVGAVGEPEDSTFAPAGKASSNQTVSPVCTGGGGLRVAGSVYSILARASRMRPRSRATSRSAHSTETALRSTGHGAGGTTRTSPRRTQAARVRASRAPPARS